MINRRIIDWQATGQNLKLLRCDNINLRRTVCHDLSVNLVKGHLCKTLDCQHCNHMDSQISQAELAVIMNVSDSMIANWETNRTIPTLEDLFLYCDLCVLSLDDVLVYSVAECD